MMSNTAPVAVFDSGVGGIGVLRELQKELPDENFLYFGDCANAPYGERKTDEIRELVLARAERLFCRAKALVLACNTATAAAVAELRRRWAEPIVGMEPAIHPALSVAPHPKILVLATAATLREEKFAALLAACKGEAEITPLAAPGLVRFAESGVTGGRAVREYLSRLLAPFRERRFDAAVLGCTHFPFFRAELLRAFGYPLPLFDGAAGTARETAHRLAAAHLTRPPEIPGGESGDMPGLVVHPRSALPQAPDGTVFSASRNFSCGEADGALAAPIFISPNIPCGEADGALYPAPQSGSCWNPHGICAAHTSAASQTAPPVWRAGRVVLASSRRETLPLMQKLLFT